MVRSLREERKEWERYSGSFKVRKGGKKKSMYEKECAGVKQRVCDRYKELENEREENCVREKRRVWNEDIECESDTEGVWKWVKEGEILRDRKRGCDTKEVWEWGQEKEEEEGRLCKR